MQKLVAYLGPEGTFTESAAVKHSPDAKLKPYPSISSVVSAITDGEAEEGIVPIENSLQGSVNDTLDLLIQRPKTFIRGELVLPVEHSLLVRSATKSEDIRVIYSHPQALAQCRYYLEAHFSGVATIASLSTAAAAEQVKHSKEPDAAIGTTRAASLYGLEILEERIQDNQYNVTRFAVIGPSDHKPTGRDKTTLCFSFDDDRPGLLYGVMKQFADLEINLGKLESRPTGKSLGQYIFLVDLDGHRADPGVSRAIEYLDKETSWFRVFGSYPRYE